MNVPLRVLSPLESLQINWKAYLESYIFIKSWPMQSFRCNGWKQPLR